MDQRDYLFNAGTRGRVGTQRYNSEARDNNDVRGLIFTSYKEMMKFGRYV